MHTSAEILKKLIFLSRDRNLQLCSLRLQPAQHRTHLRTCIFVVVASGGQKLEDSPAPDAVSLLPRGRRRRGSMRRRRRARRRLAPDASGSGQPACRTTAAAVSRLSRHSGAARPGALPRPARQHHQPAGRAVVAWPAGRAFGGSTLPQQQAAPVGPDAAGAPAARVAQRACACVCWGWM